MADEQEYAIGTDAAMRIAQADIDQAVPSFFRSEIPIADVQKLVADIVKAGLDAVDAFRVKQSQPKETA